MYLIILLKDEEQHLKLGCKTLWATSFEISMATHLLFLPLNYLDSIFTYLCSFQRFVFKSSVLTNILVFLLGMAFTDFF